MASQTFVQLRNRVPTLHAENMPYRQLYVGWKWNLLPHGLHEVSPVLREEQDWQVPGIHRDGRGGQEPGFDDIVKCREL